MGRPGVTPPARLVRDSLARNYRSEGGGREGGREGGRVGST